MDEPWTIGRLLDWTAKFLAQKGSEFPRLDTEVLLSHAVGCKRIELYTRYDEPATEEARARFKELIRKRVEGCPVAYLVGRKEFFSLEFEVGPAVLIPRPDTETLVAEALRLAKEMAEPNVLDIGAGSGAIPVAVAKNHKGAKVTATDVSPEALEVARRNAAKHGVADRVTVLVGDLFAPLPPGSAFDLVVSNPPYVTTKEWESLSIDIREHEPRGALDGGPDGLAFYRRIAAGAAAVLNPDGAVMVEIGATQEDVVRAVFAEKGFTTGPAVKDLARRPRVVVATR